LTDENGEIVETYEYDIYGKPVIRDENGDPVVSPMTPFLFTGHYWDADTGLYLTMYRAFSPELGRWLTRDPIDFSGNDINLYNYVSNNPLNLHDPLGLFSLPKLGAGLLKLAAGVGMITAAAFAAPVAAVVLGVAGAITVGLAITNIAENIAEDKTNIPMGPAELVGQVIDKNSNDCPPLNDDEIGKAQEMGKYLDMTLSLPSALISWQARVGIPGFIRGVMDLMKK
jgi:RHS repeat-associated protein